MEPNVRWSGTVKVERLDGFYGAMAQLIPRVRLREDVFCQAFRAIAAVWLLYYLENQFDHTF